MWKRRVGVTARLRQIGGSQAIGSPQIATEMAAPPELRTPMGTAAGAAKRVRMEAWRTVARESADRNQSKRVLRRGVIGRWERIMARNPNRRRGDRVAGDGALKARMRRCLILRQGASPLRPPAPFPSSWIVRSEEALSRVRFAGAKAPPLTELPRSEDLAYPEGKGASTKHRRKNYFTFEGVIV